MRELAGELRSYADAAGNIKVAEMCSAYLIESYGKTGSEIELASEKERLAAGYVYLIKYEKNFKIGRTNSLAKRSRQVQFELPSETILVHAILTDDPVGIEAYWHKRFSEKRGNGEWFVLTNSDIAAFKKWKKIA